MRVCRGLSAPSSVILTTSIDPRVSLMGLPPYPFPSFTHPRVYRLHSPPAWPAVYSSFAAHFCNRPSQTHAWEVRKGKTVHEWGFCVCVSWWQPQHGVSMGEDVSLSCCPTPFLSSFSPQPLGEREFYTLTLNHSRPLNRGRRNQKPRAISELIFPWTAQRSKLMVFDVTLLFVGIIDSRQLL